MRGRLGKLRSKIPGRYSSAKPQQQQTGQAEGPNWEHRFDPTQPVSEDQSLRIDNKPYVNKYYHQEIFLSQFKISNPDWAKFDKPQLKRALTETEACILVYSCTDRECFSLLVEGWDQVQSEQDISDAVARERVWVVHDNIDVDRSLWEVTVEEGQAWAEKIVARFRALSSRTGQGTEGIGLEIARQVLESDKTSVAGDKPAQASEQPSTKAKNLRACLRKSLHFK